MPKTEKSSKITARTIAEAVTHAPAETEIAAPLDIAPDPASDFAGAFGEGEAVTFAGREWNLKFLDVNDMIYLQKRLPAKQITGEDGKPKVVTGFDALDLESMEGIRLFFYLVLRKSDPSLTEDDLDNENYKITEAAVGRMMSIQNLQSPDTMKLINTILISSGLAADPTEKPRPNAGPGRKAASR